MRVLDAIGVVPVHLTATKEMLVVLVFDWRRIIWTFDLWFWITDSAANGSRYFECKPSTVNIYPICSKASQRERDILEKNLDNDLRQILAPRESTDSRDHPEAQDSSSNT